MDVVALPVQKRDKALKASEVRRLGLIPAECYGGGKDNFSLQMDYQVFRKAYIAAGENTVVDLEVDNAAPLKVLVHQVQFDPVTDKISHVDFVNIRMDKEVHTNIPLEFVGVSLAVKDLGGVLMTNITELEVKCLPMDLVHSILVDISSLDDFHTAIHVSDLLVSEKITVLADPERTVVTVAAPRKEEEITEEAEAEAPEGEEGAAPVEEESSEEGAE